MDTTAEGGGQSQGNRRRRTKQANSESFNTILSAANTLTVNERVRLVKSLAGQHGLLVFSAQQVAGMQAPKESAPSDEVGGKSKTMPVPRNPLKNSVFQKTLDAAKLALRQEKEKLGVAELPTDSPIWVQYTQALQAYKLERTRLGIVPAKPASGSANGTGTGARNKRVRQSSKSPNRDSEGTSTTTTSNASLVRNALQRLTGNKAKPNTDQEMKDL